MTAVVPVRPASTVALLRDHDGGLETLLVRRNRALAFAGGFWVFPGGAVDDRDRSAANGDDDTAARLAAAREAHEEAGVVPDPEGMVLVSHWTTPVEEKKRFATWFFAVAVPSDTQVVIDGSEIHDYRWIAIDQALREHRQGALPLMPPTFITLKALARYDGAEQAVAGERDTPSPEVLPRLVSLPGGGFVTVYAGDVAYAGGAIDVDGPRHRTVLGDEGWCYEYSGVSDVLPLYPQESA